MKTTLLLGAMLLLASANISRAQIVFQDSKGIPVNQLKLDLRTLQNELKPDGDALGPLYLLVNAMIAENDTNLDLSNVTSVSINTYVVKDYPMNQSMTLLQIREFLTTKQSYYTAGLPVQEWNGSDLIYQYTPLKEILASYMWLKKNGYFAGRWPGNGEIILGFVNYAFVSWCILINDLGHTEMRPIDLLGHVSPNAKGPEFLWEPGPGTKVFIPLFNYLPKEHTRE